MAKIFNRIKKPSLRQGVIFGLILGAIEIVLWLLASLFSQGNVQSILGVVSLSAFLLAGYMAGLRAAIATGKLVTGVIAGVWTGLIGCAIESVLPFVFVLIYLPTYVAGYQQDFKLHPNSYPGMKITDITTSYVLTGVAINLLSNVLLYTLIALIGGALGSFVGRRRMPTYAPNGAYESGEEPVLPPKKAEELGGITEAGGSAE